MQNSTSALRKNLGLAILKLRTQKELSQTQIGDSGNLSRLETGKQWVSEEQLLELSKELKTPVWLIFALAEGAIGSELWEILETYQQGDADDRALLRLTARSIKKRGK